MNLFHIDPIEFQKLLLIFFRVTAIIFVAPIFGSRNIPVQLKVGLGLIISVILFPLVDVGDLRPWGNLLSLILGMIREILIGVLISFGINLIFAGVQLAGQWIGFQMGFAIVNVIDPITETRVSVFAHFKLLLALLTYLIINAHHWLLQALVDSFRIIPMGTLHINTRLISELMRLSAEIFIIGVKVGGPIMAVVFFIEVAFGLVARTVPQMNIFIVGFPLRILGGLFIIGIAIPFIVQFVKARMDKLSFDIWGIMKLIGGG